MAKVKLDGINYLLQAPEEVCHFNSGVLCGLWASPTGKDHCARCGWNPAVNKIRKESLINVNETAAETPDGEAG